MELFDLVEALGEDGRPKALEVGEYALHEPRRTRAWASRRRLFASAEALQRQTQQVGASVKLRAQWVLTFEG